MIALLADRNESIRTAATSYFSGWRRLLATTMRRLQERGRGAAELAGRLVRFQAERFGDESATIGDAGAVCAVLDPAGVQREKLPVRVELAGTWSRGRTIVDRRDWTGDLSHDPHGLAPATIDVCLEVDAERYAATWLEAVGGGGR